MKTAILDDYQHVAAQCADWSGLGASAVLAFLNDHISDVDALVSRLAPFYVVCVMREPTPLTAEVGRPPVCSETDRIDWPAKCIDRRRRGSRAWHRNRQHGLQFPSDNRIDVGPDLGE